ncbi:CDP-glucose 4,6-dehydratase [Sphingomonas vulcanisoli]|uniref:CDP-glucose 4,6-dehydratase n=1 Tax=Sphingomonas vulcanisoli TaxID=1658060 RepID=A0ABX0TVB4_9SPHN|nr:CDP-glucose 4,6-dehydratase [Sphingomonas vulcanisoli]NIJ09452.1 CDP-glucose 4,6-dehydratase [Sphingomonas vulcanisoli]
MLRRGSVSKMTCAIDPNFWRGKKVLLTGHTGFKGAWLSFWLHQLGAEVTGFSIDVPTSPSLFDKLGIAGMVRDIRGDVRDLAAVEGAVKASGAEIVLHLAAQSLVRLSYVKPVETFATNVMGTVHVLEAARQAGVAEVLIVTSDKCYENREWLWSYRETDAMGGYDPYSSSKGCAELVASAYARAYPAFAGAPLIVSARAGNVIGGGDWALDRLIPDLVRGFASGASVEIRSPGAVRPWQHVLEPIGGYLMLVQKCAEDPSFAAQGWNFGPNSESERTVRDIAMRMCAIWSKPEGWKDVSASGAVHEAHLLKLDSTKARSLLGWAPRWSLEEALDVTSDYYKIELAGGDCADCATRQIADYCASVRS